MRYLRVINDVNAAIDTHPPHDKLHMSAAPLHLLHMGIGHFRAKMQTDDHGLLINGIGIEGQHRISDIFPAKDEVVCLHKGKNYKKIA